MKPHGNPLDTIECPNCGRAIPMSEALSHQIAERARAELRAEIDKQQNSLIPARHTSQDPALERLDKPVIAAINGTARGVGLDMAIMPRLAHSRCIGAFAESYINMGLISGHGGTYFRPRLIVPRARWEPRGPAAWSMVEAERIGLVNRVVADTDALGDALKLAAAIARQPEKRGRITKRSVYQGLTNTLASHLEAVSSHGGGVTIQPSSKRR